MGETGGDRGGSGELVSVAVRLHRRVIELLDDLAYARGERRSDTLRYLIFLALSQEPAMRYCALSKTREERRRCLKHVYDQLGRW